MILTDYALEKIGFEKLQKEEIIEATLCCLHLYQASGFNLPEDGNKVFSWDLNGENIKLALGNDLNAMCRLLYNDDLVDGLAEWEKEKGCQAPYLAILFGPTKKYSVSDCRFQRKDGILITYDSFETAKSDLRNLSEEYLPRILAALTCEYSRLAHRVDFKPVDYVVFGETEEGERLNDIRFTMTANIVVSSPLQNSEMEEILNDSAKLAEKLEPKIAGFFELGLKQSDRLKAFLFYFFPVEIFTHKTFQKIDHKAKIEGMIDTEARVSEAAKSLFEVRSEYMKSLNDRFVWCVINVWSGFSDKDVNEFKKLKKVRDDIAHGSNVEPTQEHVDSIRDIATRALRH